jgi:hypothetical protein
MLEHSKNYNNIKNQLYAFGWKSFELETFVQAGFSLSEAEKLMMKISLDKDFLNINSIGGLDSWRFISSERIIRCFLEINLRPLGTFNELIGKSRMHNFIKMKLDLKKELFNIRDILNFLYSFGLIKVADSKYVFPLPHLLHHIKRFKYQEETALAFDVINNITQTDKLKYTSRYIFERLLSVLNTLKQKEENVFIKRYGILDGKRSTLEETGLPIGLTRERIRQIQKTGFSKLRHFTRQNKIKALYYSLLISNKGSIFVSKNLFKEAFNAIALIFDVLGVRYQIIDDLLIIGGENIIEACFDESMLWYKEVNMIKVREQLNRLGYWWIGDEDAETIFQYLNKICPKKQLRFHRIYITLKELGEPSHFSTIALKHNEMFPNNYGSERNIHAAICYHPEYFVWTGVMGIYALPEWGYERPNMGLFETCYKIVDEQYNKTKKPVDYSYVQSQIHKYRKLVNPNSVMFACYLNENIDVTYDKKLIPRNKAKIELIETDEDYEQIEKNLEIFEEKLKDFTA